MRGSYRRTFAVASMVVAAVGIVGLAAWWLLDSGLPTSEPPTAATLETGPVPAESMQLSVILLWALVGSVAVTAGAVVVAIRLLYWRQALQGGQTSIVPDRLLADFAKYTEALRKFTEVQERHLKAADSFRNKVAQDIVDLKEALNVFTQSLNKKDAEIERLRRGGDAVVYQRFLSRFLRLNAAFEEEVRDLEAAGDDTAALVGLHELLQDALLECGVEKLVPLQGSSYRNEYGVADNPKIIPTDDKEKHLCIAEVLRPGFVIKTADAPVCLQPAHVSVYRCSDLETPA